MKVLINDNVVKLNINRRKPKPLPRTEVLNRRHLIAQRRIHKGNRKQKSKYHKERTFNKYPLSNHPSLRHLVEKEEIVEKE